MRAPYSIIAVMLVGMAAGILMSRWLGRRRQRVVRWPVTFLTMWVVFGILLKTLGFHFIGFLVSIGGWLLLLMAIVLFAATTSLLTQSSRNQ